ncbi:MAG: BON domain-containing protein [Longimicrobiales bacterium]
MNEDFESLFDIENMSDGDLEDLVRQELHEYPEIDPDLVDVRVSNGQVQLSGRVGTEQELQQIEHVVTDVLGVVDVYNGLVVDALVRGERAEAADLELAEELQSDPQMGTGAMRTEDSARHLTPDTQSELYGTHDPQQAIQEGLAYEPPDRPVQEGTWSREQH